MSTYNRYVIFKEDNKLSNTRRKLGEIMVLQRAMESQIPSLRVHNHIDERSKIFSIGDNDTVQSKLDTRSSQELTTQYPIPLDKPKSLVHIQYNI
jgi:hypothetical protein